MINSMDTETLSAQAGTILALQRVIDERNDAVINLRDDVKQLTATVSELKDTVTKLNVHMDGLLDDGLEKRVRDLERWAWIAKGVGIAFGALTTILLYWIAQVYEVLEHIRRGVR